MNETKLYTALLILTGFILFQCDNVMNNDIIRDNKYRAESDFEFTVSAQGTNRIVIECMNGFIRVTGQTDSQTAVITGVKVVKSSSERDAESYLNQLSVNVEKQASNLLVSSQQPSDNDGRDVSFEFFIRVPDFWIVQTELVNGECTIDSLHNKAVVKVINGNVLLQQLNCNAEIRVTNGQIAGSVNLPLNGELFANTTNGLINLMLPSTVSAQFYAKVTNGLIQLGNLSLNDSINSQREIRGVLGSGEGDIWLETTNGNIVVNGY